MARTSPTDLEGLTAVVTGGARGIGLAIARELATRGANVALGDLDPDVAEVAAEVGAESDVAALGTDLDVTDPGSVDAAFRVVTETLGPPDLLVNIASMSARIVNVPQAQTSYNVSEAAVEALTRSLAVEWIPLGIRVNAVSPGYTASEMTRQFTDAHPELGAAWRSRIPTGEMGEPEDVAGLVAWLLSPAARAASLVALTEFNLGVEGDFRVPDLGFIPADEEDQLGLYVPSASIVVEIVSPDDASYAKVPFYLGRGVREVWLLDPTEQILTIHTRTPVAGTGAADVARRSTVLGLEATDITVRLGW